jgi:hypothetical protein
VTPPAAAAVESRGLESNVSNAPCCNCRSLNNGRLTYWYLATYEGREERKYRLRLCNVCSEAFMPALVDVADVRDSFGSWLPREVQL